MKINNLIPSSASINAELKKVQQTDLNAQAFNTFMAAAEEAQGGLTNPLADQAASSLNSTALNSSSLVGQLLAASQAQAQNAVSANEQLDKTLDLLEQYSQALGDPAQSLKSMAPLAEELGAEAAKLSASSQKVDNPELKSLFDQTAILATVESMKFKRGDYI